MILPLKLLGKHLKISSNILLIMRSAHGFLRLQPTTALILSAKKRKQTLSIDKSFDTDEGGELTLDVRSELPDPSEDLMKKEKVERMHEVVEKLKPRYKQLVELRYFQELSYEEISDQLKLPLGTVKAQLFRAREFLYQIMKNSEHKL